MNLKKIALIGSIGIGLLAGNTCARRNTMQIKGSDTMVNLIQILAEAYIAKNPKAPIAVLGGGSGTGIAALINGTCSIANHSRPVKDKEYQMAKENGADPRTFVIAIDGLSVIVNENNPLKKLGMDQVGAIYRGEIKNWKEVGGPDKSISLYGRQSNSGTYVFFQEHVLGKQNYSADMKRMNGNAQIVEGVTADQAGIGYVGVGYVFDKDGKVKNGLTVLEISLKAGEEAYSPLDSEAVESGKYPVVRGLFQSTRDIPTGAVLDFMKFQLGPEGQRIVTEEGFFKIGASQQAENQKNFIK